MKINAISNTNFKGLFTDKSAQNGGNWKMEYSPYAWEAKYFKIDSKMANQENIDIFGTCLPDNEKIYTNENGKKSAKDILGTEFYYEYENGKVRKTITEVPAMNREDSLKVYNKKLDKFLKMKKDKSEEMKKEVSETPKSFKDLTYNFYEHAEDIKHRYLGRTYYLKYSSQVMIGAFNQLKDSANGLVKKFDEYATLRDSMDDVKHYISENKAEIELLEEKRKSGKLIDISRRDVYDPNQPLWKALQNVREAAQKYVALPHKTISVREILNAVGGKVKEADIPNLAIKYIDTLIEKRI